MKMAERHADQYGVEKPPREFTKKERELLRADPDFTKWLDSITAKAVNETEMNHGDHCDR